MTFTVPHLLKVMAQEAGLAHQQAEEGDDKGRMYPGGPTLRDRVKAIREIADEILSNDVIKFTRPGREVTPEEAFGLNRQIPAFDPALDRAAKVLGAGDVVWDRFFQQEGVVRESYADRGLVQYVVILDNDTTITRHREELNLIRRAESEMRQPQPVVADSRQLSFID